MLSRRWPKPKWIKYVTVQVGSVHPSGWNVTLYLQFKRSFSFFSPNQQPSPSKLFGANSTQNVTIKWSTKVQKSVGSETSQEKHWPCMSDSRVYISDPPPNNPTVLIWFLFWGGTSHVCFFYCVHFFHLNTPHSTPVFHSTLYSQFHISTHSSPTFGPSS